MTRKRVGVLISGRGSNMACLIRAAAEPEYPARIVGVISNRAAAQGLDIASQNGIETRALAQSAFADRDAFERALTDQLEAWQVDIVALAGFMRILGDAFVEHWRGRLINIHPSLLPRYRGLDTHARAIADGARRHGCSVHFVTPGLDEGPVIAQAEVPVLPGDTAESLAARVLIEEHRLYPDALARVARGEVHLPHAPED